MAQFAPPSHNRIFQFTLLTHEVDILFLAEPKVADVEAALAKVKSLQKYLDDALAERENLAADYKKHPNDRSYGKIIEKNRAIEQLHVSVG